MKRLLDVTKAFLLAAALLIVAWSAVTGDAQASDVCIESGHACHAIIDGHIYHLKYPPV